MYFLPPAVRKHDFFHISWTVPYPSEIHQSAKRHSFSVNKHASYTADTLHTWLFYSRMVDDRCPRSDFYTPACCFWHKATWQHRSSQSARDQRKERNTQKGGKKAGNERPVIVHVKPTSFTPKSSPLPTPGLKLWCWCRPPLLVGPQVELPRSLSHSERDEAVVSLDVPLEDLWARSQHTFEAGPVQLHALERAASHYGGRPGTVQQQGDFTCGGRGGGQVSWDGI